MSIPTTVTGISALLVAIALVMIAKGHHGKPVALILLFLGAMGVTGGAIATVARKLTTLAGHALDAATHMLLGVSIGGIMLVALLGFFLYERAHPTKGRGLSGKGAGKWVGALIVFAAGTMVSATFPQVHQVLEGTVVTASDTANQIFH